MTRINEIGPVVIRSDEIATLQDALSEIKRMGKIETDAVELAMVHNVAGRLKSFLDRIGA